MITYSLGAELWNSTDTLPNFRNNDLDIINMIELYALIYKVGNLVEASFYVTSVLDFV